MSGQEVGYVLAVLMSERVDPHDLDAVEVMRVERGPQMLEPGDHLRRYALGQVLVPGADVVDAQAVPCRATQPVDDVPDVVAGPGVLAAVSDPAGRVPLQPV